MTNGDKIRELDNKGLANFIYNMIVTNRDTSIFRYNELESNIYNRQRGVDFLLNIFDREVCY